MIARLAGRGHSFKGAGLYYLHDKEAMTSERVTWTQTRNMPVNEPDAAMKWMAYTSINANKLKQEAGVPLTGRKRKKGTVFTYSLSWSPEENPDKDKMLGAADETLEILGLKDHETVIIAHNDTDHPHIHMIVNLVSPVDGRVHDPEWGSKWKMSDWSLEYERKNEKIFCLQREENHRARAQGQTPRYQEPRHHLKEKIQTLYSQSRNGKEFTAALEKAGFALAKGNRRRFVLVDDNGKIYSLSRQLDKDGRKTHLQKLADIDQKSLPHAQTVAQDKQYFDRDKYEAQWQMKIGDAAVEEAKKSPPEKDKPLKEEFTRADEEQGRGKGFIKTLPEEGEKHTEKQPENQKFRPIQTKQNLREGKEKDISGQTSPKKPTVTEPYYKEYDRIKKFERWADSKRNALKKQQDEIYQREALVKKIKTLEEQVAANDNAFGRLTKKVQKLQDELEAKKKNLEHADWRISEQTAALEAEIERAKPQKPHSEKSEIIEEKQRKIQALKTQINQKPEPPKDRGQKRDFER